MAPDGSVVLLSGTADIGSGSRTAQVMIVANELGLDPAAVRLVLPDTDVVPDAGPTVASRSTYIMGNAVLQATKVIRDSLLEVASEQLEAAPDDLELVEGQIQVVGSPSAAMPIKEAAYKAWDQNKPLRHEGHAVMWKPENPKADLTYPAAHSIYNFATQIAQVLVDIETGLVRVEKIWSAHDVGKVINQLGLEGQIDGGVVQGVGSTIMEELIVREGRLTNASLEGYLVPTAVDVPEIIPLVVEVPDPSGPYGAKGMAEAPLAASAAAIANAVFDAVGVRTWEIPMTPERILKAIDQQEKEPE
jgi:CO/xanthine dehydrogenase Mo-binding subunit